MWFRKRRFRGIPQLVLVVVWLLIAGVMAGAGWLLKPTNRPPELYQAVRQPPPTIEVMTDSPQVPLDLQVKVRQDGSATISVALFRPDDAVVLLAFNRSDVGEAPTEDGVIELDGNPEHTAACGVRLLRTPWGAGRAPDSQFVLCGIGPASVTYAGDNPPPPGSPPAAVELPLVLVEPILTMLDDGYRRVAAPVFTVPRTRPTPYVESTVSYATGEGVVTSVTITSEDLFREYGFVPEETPITQRVDVFFPEPVSFLSGDAQVVDDGHWTWDDASSAARLSHTALARTHSAEDRDQQNTFYAGISLGLAGTALAAAFQLGQEPLLRRKANTAQLVIPPGYVLQPTFSVTPQPPPMAPPAEPEASPTAAAARPLAATVEEATARSSRRWTVAVGSLIGFVVLRKLWRS